jgi:hypothetical protein
MKKLLILTLLLSAIILSACGSKTSELEAKVQSEDAKSQVEKLQIEVKASATSKLNELQKKIADGAPDLEIQILSLEITNDFPNTTEALQATELSLPANARLKAEEDRVIKEQEALDAAEKQANEKIKKKMLVSFNKSVDNVSEVKFYSHKSFGNGLRTAITPYISASVSGGNPFSRFKFMYYGDDWLFVKSLEINCSGEHFSITFDGFGEDSVKRDNASGSVWEWVDIPLTSEHLEFLKCAADTQKKVVYNIMGSNYRKEVTMSKKHQEAIKETLYLYDHYSDIGMK